MVSNFAQINPLQSSTAPFSWPSFVAAPLPSTTTSFLFSLQG
uniref:Uncharacterized protein n=1 Tax=Lotus japonicus TaxID=34305 RepID=I3T3N1_LOTJA|nr:unknown [Lotus japonicus]